MRTLFCALQKRIVRGTYLTLQEAPLQSITTAQHDHGYFHISTRPGFHGLSHYLFRQYTCSCMVSIWGEWPPEKGIHRLHWLIASTYECNVNHIISIHRLAIHDIQLGTTLLFLRQRSENGPVMSGPFVGDQPKRTRWRTGDKLGQGRRRGRDGVQENLEEPRGGLCLLSTPQRSSDPRPAQRSLP